MLKFYYVLSIAGLFLFGTLQAQEGEVNPNGWTLERCIDYALNNNLDIQGAMLNQENLQITLDQNKWNRAPTLNGNAGAGVNIGRRIDPFTNTFATNSVTSGNIGIGVGVTIFNGFQINNSIKQAGLDQEAGKANLETAQNSVALNVANAYLNALFNAEFLAVAESNLDASNTQFQRVVELYNAGAAPEGSKYDLEAQVARDQAAVIQAENNFGLALLSLAQLINLPPEQWNDFVVVKPNLNDPQSNLPTDVNVVLQNALNTFPQVRAAQLAEESANVGLDIAKGSFLPRLSASYNYGSGYSENNRRPVGEAQLGDPEAIGFVEGTNQAVLQPTVFFEDFETLNLVDQFTDNLNQSFFVSLSVPIFNGFSAKYGVQRAKVGQLQANLNRESTELQLTQEVYRAYADSEVSLKNYEAAQRTLAATEKAFEYAQIRFEQGVDNAADYNDSRVRLDNAKADMIRQKFDYIFKLKVLDFYTGQPITLQP